MPKLSRSRHTLPVQAALASLFLLPGVTAKAQFATPARHTLDVAVGFAAEHTLRSNSDQNFWLQGGSASAGLQLWHGLGPALDVTGVHASSVGTSGIPLSLFTATAGPRLRLHRTGRWSPYGQFLVGVSAGFDSAFPRSTSTTTEATSFAFVTGGGLDVSLQRSFFLRPVDVSFVHTQLPNGTNNSQNILRMGAGLGWRFHSH